MAVGTVQALVAATLVAAGAAEAPGGGRGAAKERVEVEDVLRTGDGQFVVVLRTQRQPLRYLPIWIGEAEAVAIRMRLDRQEPPRPLTLNLLERVLSGANIRVTEVAIDDYKGGIYLGRVRLRQSSRAWDVEARPSDAIGLAVGRRAPIWVARAVLRSGAVDPGALEHPPAAPPAAGDEEAPGTALEESL